MLKDTVLLVKHWIDYWRFYQHRLHAIMTAINFHSAFPCTTDFMHAWHISPSGSGRYQHRIQKMEDHGHNKRSRKLSFPRVSRALVHEGRMVAREWGERSKPVLCGACPTWCPCFISGRQHTKRLTGWDRYSDWLRLYLLSTGPKKPPAAAVRLGLLQQISHKPNEVKGRRLQCCRTVQLWQGCAGSDISVLSEEMDKNVCSYMGCQQGIYSHVSLKVLCCARSNQVFNKKTPFHF